LNAKYTKDNRGFKEGHKFHSGDKEQIQYSYNPFKPDENGNAQFTIHLKA